MVLLINLIKEHMKLTDNTILITGGTSGIGLELGKRLLKDNKVILLGRNKETLNELKKIGFETIACDLTDRNDIDNALTVIEDMYPDLNVLFNNAGVQNNYLFTETPIPLSRIGDEVNINLSGQMVLTNLLMPVLTTQTRSFIINTTSALGAFPKPDALVYSASKAGMRNFTKGLRYAFKKMGVTVMEFIPPVTATNMTKHREEDKMGVEELVDKILPQIKDDRKILTTKKVRLFLVIAFLFPKLANKILSK